MKLRDARIKSGKTVKEVMDSLDVSDAAVYLWETGGAKPKLENLIKLSKLYGVSLDELAEELVSDDPPEAS